MVGRTQELEPSPAAFLEYITRKLESKAELKLDSWSWTLTEDESVQILSQVLSRMAAQHLVLNVSSGKMLLQILLQCIIAVITDYCYCCFLVLEPKIKFSIHILFWFCIFTFKKHLTFIKLKTLIFFWESIDHFTYKVY